MNRKHGMFIGPVFFAYESSFPRKNVTPCSDTGRESSQVGCYRIIQDWIPAFAGMTYPRRGRDALDPGFSGSTSQKVSCVVYLGVLNLASP